MGCRPVDSAAALAHRESLLARVHEWRHSLPHRFAAHFKQLRVALRASHERAAARIDRKLFHHLAKLVAEQL